MWAEPVMEQVARLLERQTGLVTGRAADRDDDVFEQPVGASPGYLPVPKRIADIDVVAIEVAHFVGDVEAQLDARPRCAKIVDAPHQPFCRELSRPG